MSPGATKEFRNLDIPIQKRIAVLVDKIEASVNNGLTIFLPRDNQDEKLKEEIQGHIDKVKFANSFTDVTETIRGEIQKRKEEIEKRIQNPINLASLFYILYSIFFILAPLFYSQLFLTQIFFSFVLPFHINVPAAAYQILFRYEQR